MSNQRDFPLLSYEEKMRPFFAVCEAADTVMHHYADSHWHADSFAKMVEAMEPLRQALVAAGYGTPPEGK